MIISKKYLLLIAWILFYISLSGDNKSGPMMDIHNKPISQFTEIEKKIGEYYTLDGDTLTFCSNISFKHEKDSLINYLSDLYFNHPKFQYYEINLNLMYTILFNNELEIIETRIVGGYYSSGIKDLFMSWGYDILIDDILRATEGEWKINDESWDGYFLFGGNFRII